MMDEWRRRDKWDWYGATAMVWVLIAAIVIGWFTYANSF